MALNNNMFDNGELDLNHVQEVVTGISAKDNVTPVTESTDRFGQVRDSLPELLKKVGWYSVGDWASNPYLTKPNEYVFYNNQRFAPSTLPYQVDSAANPNPNALVGTELVDVSKFTTEEWTRENFKITYKSVYDMISGVPYESNVGDYVSTGKTVFKRVGDSSNDITDFKCVGDFVSASDLGFVYDGVTDNLDKFNTAKATLSPVGLGIDFDEKGTVYISSNRPDLTGVRIKANPTFNLKVDQNPNVKEMTLESDITIENPSHVTSLVKHKNKGNDYLLSAGASLSVDSYSQPEKINYTSSDVTLASITGVNTKGPFTGNATESIISWTSEFASGQQGVFLVAEQEAFYEIAVRHTGNAVYNPSAFKSACVITPTKRLDFAVYVGRPQYTLIDSTSGVIETGETPNGGAYSLSSFGAVTIGVRVVDKLAEFYINSTLIASYEMDATPSEVGFLTASNQSNLAQMNNLTKQSSKKVATSSPTTIAVVGDSQSYGAWASNSYDEILKKTMVASGLGVIESVNYAVSGSSTSEWLPGGSIDIDSVDLSSSEYTLIMLGTNDVQGSVAGLTFESNLRTIISRVQAQGSKPVIGVFPVYTSASVTGITGVTTQNYEKGGWHRQLVKWVAADLNIPIAEVCESFGTNIGLFGDNIHPTEEGQILVASAFAKAILEDKKSKESRNASSKLTLMNGWASVGSSGAPVVTSKKSIVNLTGAINGGVVGSTIATLHDSFKPSRTKTFVCAISNGGDHGFCHIRVQADGQVILQYSSEPSISLLWLDGVCFSPEA